MRIKQARVHHSSPQVFVVANQKGGTGKTTTVVTLGAGFALQGKKVLIVDADSQGHVALCFGLSRSNGLFQLLVQKQKLTKIIVEARDHLFIVPNDHTSLNVQQYLSTLSFREYLLRTALEQAHDFDVVIIDTSPSIDFLHILCLVASNYLIIPTKLDFCALDGVQQVLGVLQSIFQYPSVTPPKLLGVLPFQADRTTSESRTNLMELTRTIGPDLIFPAIPVDTKAREASAQGQTIWEYSPHSPAVVGYQAVNDAYGSNHPGGYQQLVKQLLPYIE